MGKEEIEDMVAPQKRSLANTGIQLQDVVDEKVTTLSPWLVRERCWLAIWSGPDLISNSDRTAHDELVRKLAERVPKARFAQSPAVDLICTENPPRSFFLIMWNRH